MNPDDARRQQLLNAAADLFLRFGFRKTSMDDVARAAGLSRQGLYLHFRSKHELFRAVVVQLIETTRSAAATQLRRRGLPLEERLVDAFAGMLGPYDTGHLAELFEAAGRREGDLVARYEERLATELVLAIESSDLFPAWQEAGIPAGEVARHLLTLSQALKQQVTSREQYLSRMRSAVRLVCLGPRLALGTGPAAAGGTAPQQAREGEHRRA